VAPGAAEPLHGLAGPGITGEVAERIEDVIQAHLPHPVQQGARVAGHHPGLAALAGQLPDELAHALLAPREYRRIVVVADVLMVHHPRQVADDRRGAQVAADRDWLVHVQRDRNALAARSVSASCGNTAYSRPAVIASLISGSCKHRFGRPSTYSASGSMGSLPQAHLCRMYS
jgi:hypothetical protein